MLDINFIRENKKLVQDGAKAKGRKVDVEKLLKLDDERRELLTKVEKLRSLINKISKVKNQNDKLEIKKNIEKLKKLKWEVKALEPSLESAQKQFNYLMLQIPNPPAKSVKIGQDAASNEVVRTWGQKPQFNFEPKNHIELGKKNGWIDMERAAKVSGSRFYYLTGQAVEIELALVQFALRKLKAKGFTPVIPPHLISEKAMRGMGYLEHGEDQEVYHLEKDNLYLIGTSEQAIGVMHMDEILEEKNLPLHYVGFSPCYRREAGSYGRDTKGILRAHQFDKVEMFSFCQPAESEKEHQLLLSLEEEMMQELKLPYQVVKICSGDLGDPAAKKFDIETWMSFQKKYRETHSTSNTTDFQARRLNIRYKDKLGKTTFVHMLNGTAIAIGRTLIAIMENCQQKDGSVKIPEVLRKYL